VVTSEAATITTDYTGEFCHIWSCVLQLGSGETPLKYDEIYGMNFVANFMENTIVKKILKFFNICQTYEEMYGGTVFIETWCSSTTFVNLIVSWYTSHHESDEAPSPASNITAQMHIANYQLTAVS